MSYNTNLFINGKYTPSSTGDTLAIYSPFDDSLINDQVQVASKEDVDTAVKAAATAFPGWRSTPGLERGAMMNRFADLLERNIEKLASLECKAMGQPMTTARGSLATAISIWRYYAGSASKIIGESHPPDGDGLFKIVQYEPLGVCAGICAWNVSHLQTAWKAAPALAAGNTFILKSSEKAPLALCQYGDLINEAGFPPGVLNIIAGAGPVGALLSEHMGVEKIAFTGSAATGRRVQLAATQSNLKKVTLELGGKSPAIIFNDANLKNAVFHSSISFLRNSAQVCVAASRVLVQQDIAGAFIKELQTAFEEASMRMGDPSLDNTLFGPLADRQHFNNVMKFVEQAKNDGIEVLTGGERVGKTGTFLQPTVFLNPDLDSRVYKDEIFGPVLCVRTFQTEDEALQLANDTRFGLGATIYTADLARALRIAGKVEAGTVGINTAFVTSKSTPFGGWKESGTGREGGLEGIRGYLQAKTIHVNMSPIGA